MRYFSDSTQKQTAFVMEISKQEEADSKEEAPPTTFREAEVLGLKLMQEQKYEEALDGTRFCVMIPSPPWITPG